MPTYMDHIKEVALDSQICCQVLLSADNQDLEFQVLSPTKYRETETPLTPAEFCTRRLRSVGWVGLSGLTPRSAWKETLPESVVVSIGLAFSAFVRSLLGGDFAGKVAEHIEIAMLDRMYSLRDPRNDC